MSRPGTSWASVLGSSANKGNEIIISRAHLFSSVNLFAQFPADWHLTSSLSDYTGIEHKFWKVKTTDGPDQLRRSILQMRELGIREFLLLASVRKTRMVLTVARRLGIVSVPYAWLILHLVNTTPFQTKVAKKLETHPESDGLLPSVSSCVQL